MFRVFLRPAGTTGEAGKFFSRMPRLPLCIALLVAPALLQPARLRAETSALWGKTGEARSPASRLPDYSFCGYHFGEASIPDYPISTNARDFGAKGDGVTDDTDALRRAIAATKSGALLIPAGRYVVSGFLDLDRSGIVLRGEGADKTRLFFPKPLGVIDPRPTENTGGTPTQEWSWSGGFVRLAGKAKKTSASTIRLAADAPRGSKSVTLESATAFAPGDTVALHEADPGDMSFVKHLYAGDPGDTKNFPKKHPFRFPLRVVSVSGKTIVFDRELPLDFKTKWGAELQAFTPGVTESGVERLTFEFPVTPYGGHFKEAGFNPVQISDAAHCWLREVRFENADSGPMVSGDFCTLTGIAWVSARKPDKSGHTGHHGMILGGTQNLVTGFKIQTRFIHDLTVSSGSFFNAFTHGSAVDMAFDHHERAPTGNLFSDIDLGAGTRPFLCGGGAALGKNCAAYATFWNLRSAKPVPFPKPAFGPALINLVGVPAAGKTVLEPQGVWYEPIAPETLEPQDIHAAQLKRRLGAK